MNQKLLKIIFLPLIVVLLIILWVGVYDFEKAEADLETTQVSMDNFTGLVRRGVLRLVSLIINRLETSTEPNPLHIESSTLSASAPFYS